jgi:NAD(P)-dependent dehydrogenase (short-subunit alcohol dehydrogenase family)
MRMRGKIALVTGAASGIGRATAIRFATAGARVACADIDSEAARETARTIVAAGGEAIALGVDVTDPDGCTRLVETACDRLGALTTVVNSAGVRPAGRDSTPVPEEWARVVDANLSGTYFVSRAALLTLAASGNGTITNLASIYGLVGGSLSPAYAASKGAVVNLTRQMALQWAPAVRVNCVCPGVIETAMTADLMTDPRWREFQMERHPLRRFGAPDDVASAILFLASDEASFVTGVALPVDGGYTAA